MFKYYSSLNLAARPCMEIVEGTMSTTKGAYQVYLTGTISRTRLRLSLNIRFAIASASVKCCDDTLDRRDMSEPTEHNEEDARVTNAGLRDAPVFLRVPPFLYLVDFLIARASQTMASDESEGVCDIRRISGKRGGSSVVTWGDWLPPVAPSE